MSLIYFYEATDLDKQQLSDELSKTDHQWHFKDSPISKELCDPNTEVISVFVTSHVTREIIEALPKLRLIACRSTGFDHIDLTAAKEHGVTVVNVPTYGEATVAEYTFMLLLALFRRLPATLNSKNGEQVRGNDLEGKTLGIIGTGHIGRHVIKMANGFSMKVIAYDTAPLTELEQTYGFTYVGLDELLKKADIISLHVPSLPSTQHMINKARLRMMKPGAVLINTARGELVDTAALVAALTDGHLGGAALDVVEGEGLLHTQEAAASLQHHPIPESDLRHNMELSLLKKMPNVILTPHNAFNTTEAIGRINHTTAQNIIDFWYGRIPNEVHEQKKPYGKLFITRHAESEWNATGRWTGITDVHLSDKGFKQSVQLGLLQKELDTPLDIAYCSQQIRTRETLEGILDASQQFDVQVVMSAALNERDYGDYTGKNKWEMKELLGQEAFSAVRRGWDAPIPGGETLKMVYERVVPFYLETIVPELKSGKNVLIVAHGNSIRALKKYLLSISDEAIQNVEMPFGYIDIHDINAEGRSKQSSTVTIESLSLNQ